jgi:beta-1,4-mannosyl-glycoprotein beta-1,4-N-acetylglucosaminyltransferase
MIKNSTSFSSLISSYLTKVGQFVDSYLHPIEYKRKVSQEIRNYRKKIKIYDIFNFFNEIELLEVRLNILNKHVDYFVIVESTLTHSGLPKELYFNKNKRLFSKFKNKIIHLIIEVPIRDFDDAKQRLANAKTPQFEKDILSYALSSKNVPSDAPHFLRDFYEKEYVKKALLNLNDNDICFISDLDEIWNPETVIDFRVDTVFKLKQDVYTYYLNNRSSELWAGTIVTKYKNIKDSCLNHLRSKNLTKHRYIANGGWHFTFQGGADRVKQKLASYSHQEFNNSSIKSQVKDRIGENKDILNRNFKYWIDSSNLPDYLIKNQARYKKFFKK